MLKTEFVALFFGMIGSAIMDIYLQSIILFLTGLVASTYASVVGGGGLVSFPVLILLGFPVDVAIGTNRFNAIFMEGSSFIAFSRRRLVQWKIAIPIAIVSVPASIWGARLALSVSGKTLDILVAVILSVLLIALPRVKPQERPVKDGLSRGTFLGLGTICILLAVYGGFHGAAYGTFILFPFILLGTSSLLQASANARLIGCLVSIAASVVFIQNGSVNYAAAIPQILGAVIGAQIGVKYALKHLKWAKYALTVVVVASIIKLLFEIV